MSLIETNGRTAGRKRQRTGGENQSDDKSTTSRKLFKRNADMSTINYFTCAYFCLKTLLLDQKNKLTAVELCIMIHRNQSAKCERTCLALRAHTELAPCTTLNRAF